MFQFDRRQPAPQTKAPGYARAGFGLATLPAALWRRKLWPIALAVMFGGLAAAYSATLVNQYQAMAQVLVDPRDLKILANDVSPNNLNSDSITAYIESQARVITSFDMLRRIVDREGLAKDGEFSGSSSSLLSRLLPLKEEGDKTLGTAERLGRNLWARRGERTFIIDIVMTSSSPEKSARLANAFANAYLEDQANYRAELSRRTSNSLTGRLNELRERVRKSEDRIQTYKSEKNIVGANGKLITEEQLVAVNSQLALARSRLADAKSKMEQIESLRGQAAERGAVPEAVNSQTIGILRQQLGEAQRRASSLAISLGPSHPEFLAAQSSLRDAQRGIADELTRIRAAARAEFERSTSNERSVSVQLDVLKKETLVSGGDTVLLRELDRELEANRAVYQSFLQRARETGEQETVDSTNARIITTAVPPDERTGPPRRLIVMGSAAGGFLLGLMLAVLAEFMASQKNRSRIEDEAEASEDNGELPLERDNRPPTWQPRRDGGPVSAPPAGYAYATVPTENRPASAEDLTRLLQVLGRLEKAIDRNGMPR